MVQSTPSVQLELQRNSAIRDQPGLLLNDLEWLGYTWDSRLIPSDIEIVACHSLDVYDPTTANTRNLQHLHVRNRGVTKVTENTNQLLRQHLDECVGVEIFPSPSSNLSKLKILSRLWRQEWWISWKEDSLLGSIVPVALSRSISRCLYHFPPLRHGKALLFLHGLYPHSGFGPVGINPRDGSMIQHGLLLNFNSMLFKKNVALTWMTGPIFVNPRIHPGHEVMFFCVVQKQLSSCIPLFRRFWVTLLSTTFRISPGEHTVVFSMLENLKCLNQSIHFFGSQFAIQLFLRNWILNGWTWLIKNLLNQLITPIRDCSVNTELVCWISCAK